MRKDIREAYIRVIGKAWRDHPPLKPLTKNEALKYLRRTYKLWTGSTMPDWYLSGWTFVPANKSGSYAERRTWRGQIALTNWNDLNHEWSHWLFYSKGPIRTTGGGYSHHCDRHMEWERTGAELICKRFSEPKTKMCRRCKQDLPEAKFGISRKLADGLQPYCRPCVKDYAQQRKQKLTANAWRLDA